VDVADTPDGMASRIVELLRNPSVARERGRESRRRVAAEYHWGRSLDRLLELLESPQAAVSTVS
jgi:glycosyltransferase involved in cell wall biosynthesis